MFTGCLLKLLPTLGLCAGVALEFFPPVTAARLLIKINIKNQCLAMLVKPEQMPQCCWCRLLQSQAALAQNPLLCAVFPRFRSFCFSIWVNKCGVNKTVNISSYQSISVFTWVSKWTFKNYTLSKMVNISKYQFWTSFKMSCQKLHAF